MPDQETKEYILRSPPSGLSGGFGDYSTGETKYLKHDGKVVVYFQVRQNYGNPFCVVPGYKASEPYKTEYGKDAIRDRTRSKRRTRQDYQGSYRTRRRANLVLAIGLRNNS